MYWTRVWNSWLCCTYQVHRVDPQTAPLQGLHREERTYIHGMYKTTDYPIAKQPSQQNPHASASHQNTQISYGPKGTTQRLCTYEILGSHMYTISVSFPVKPRPDGGVPVNTHSKSPIDATCALIGRVLVLMTLNPFERVAVSLKLVSMLLLLHYSSPPASLVFAVFSCEQILKRPSRIEFVL